MKIAIPLIGLRLADHLGRATEFAVLDVDPVSGNIFRLVLCPSPARETIALSTWLQDRGVQVLIAAGMAATAQTLLLTQGSLAMVAGAPGECIENLVAHWREDARAGQSRALVADTP